MPRLSAADRAAVPRPLVTARASLVVLLAVIATLVGGSPPAVAAPWLSDPGGSGSRWRWPLDPVPRVLRGFEAPSGPFGPGHRGIDLSADLGQQVLAVADGTVTFAGDVAGRGVVVLDDGELRSTYLPVAPAVHAGQRVTVGQVVGTLELTGSHCLPATCLHLGARRGSTYIDPLPLLPVGRIRLEPLDGLQSLMEPPGWPGDFGGRRERAARAQAGRTGTISAHGGRGGPPGGWRLALHRLWYDRACGQARGWACV